MSYADSINEEQKATIQSWADDGNDLSLIQKKLAEELSVQVTYMEVRFLMGDLGIKMPAKEEPVEEVVEEKEEEVTETPAEEEVAGDEPVGNEAQDTSAPASVTVTMSEVLPPEALAGGTVVFSDGVNATWSLNQMGQLSLNAPDPAYRPTETDVAAFQNELQRLAQEKGM